MSEFISNNEIYQELKSGRSPHYIKGIEGFDTSELVQWLCSYHEEVKSGLLEALQDMVESYQHEASMENPSLLKARSSIAKALGESK